MNRVVLHRLVLLAVCALAASLPLAASSWAQDRPVLLATGEAGADSSAEAEVRAAVVSLFDAMRAADTTAARAVFHAGATLQSVVPTEDGYRVAPGDVDRFIAALGQPHDAAWDERIGPIRVEIDGGLAHAWMDYAFYLGDAYSHCGVNSMQLAQTDTGWRILHVVDTRRARCE